MRIRLVYTLSIWLLGSVIVSVAAMGAAAAWSLRQGFAAYVQARDEERLDRLVGMVADRLSQAGGAAALHDGRADLRVLLIELARAEGVSGAARLPDGGPRPPGHPGPRPHDPRFADGPGARHPPPRAAAPPIDAFGARVALFAPDGGALAGQRSLPGPGPWVERPVRVDGEVVALARLRPVDRIPDEHEVRFLRSQLHSIVFVATTLVLLALAAAWYLARQWARPLAEAQDATARIARGELGVRLQGTRGDEIGDVQRNINAMAESLQRMEGARRRWIADMSHELRTPLAGLRGELEALVDGVRPHTRQATLSLLDDVLRLGALVDDLHLLAMADLQRLPCRPSDLDAVELVDDVLQRFQARAGAAGLSLAWATRPLAPMPVCWDAARIEQVLGNLLQNSLRYTDAPGCIRVSLQPHGDSLVLEVEDSAPGVSAADLSRLFEPLYRADAARSRHRGGSGLGLAICEALVQAHGGHIGAGASTRGGLRVQVTLPRQAASEPTTAAASATR